MGNQADLNNYNVLLENYFHCRIALNSHNPVFIPFIIHFFLVELKLHSSRLFDLHFFLSLSAIVGFSSHFRLLIKLSKYQVLQSAAKLLLF